MHCSAGWACLFLDRSMTVEASSPVFVCLVPGWWINWSTICLIRFSTSTCVFCLEHCQPIVISRSLSNCPGYGWPLCPERESAVSADTAVSCRESCVWAAVYNTTVMLGWIGWGVGWKSHPFVPTILYRAQVFISPHSQPIVLGWGSLKAAPVSYALSHPVFDYLCCVFFPLLCFGGGNDIHDRCQHHPRP